MKYGNFVGQYDIPFTAEEKKEFYGNILSLTDVTKESAELLGICKTEYQLVK